MRFAALRCASLRFAALLRRVGVQGFVSSSSFMKSPSIPSSRSSTAENCRGAVRRNCGRFCRRVGRAERSVASPWRANRATAESRPGRPGRWCGAEFGVGLTERSKNSHSTLLVVFLPRFSRSADACHLSKAVSLFLPQGTWKTTDLSPQAEGVLDLAA